MKKLSIIAVVVALTVSVSSCKKEYVTPQAKSNSQQNIQKVPVNNNVSVSGGPEPSSGR